MWMDLENHRSNCAKVDVSCPAYQKQMKRFVIQMHRQHVCPETVVDCHFREMGCSFKVKRKDVQDHLDKRMSFHLVLAVQLIEEQKKEISQLKQQQFNRPAKQTASITDDSGDSKKLASITDDDTIILHDKDRDVNLLPVGTLTDRCESSLALQNAKIYLPCQTATNPTFDS